MKPSLMLGCFFALVGIQAANAAVIVSGTVDSAGSATLVSGAIVTLRSAGFGGAVTTLRDTTKADGAYSFASVDTGAYTIGVSATGYTTKTVNDTVTAAPSVVNVSLVAIVTSTVSGKVDSAGSATLVSGAIVTLRSAGFGGAVATLRDTTKADGAYSFAGVVAGAYTIGVSATGYTTKTVNDTVTAAPSVVNVSLVAIVTSTVSGNVDSAGSATLVSGAIVTLRSAGFGGAVTMVDTTKADGAYSFAGVVAGAYTIGVSATGYTTKTVNDTVTAAPSVVNVSLVAIVTSTVSGKVDSAGSATLLSGAIVTLRSAGVGGAVTTLRDTTKADGTYSFAGVVAGPYTIGVSATGYTTKTVNDTVTAAPSEVDVSLVAIVTSTVSGKVDSAGSATLVSGAIVTLRSAGAGGTTLRDTVKTDGTYSFTGVVTGIYTIGVSATGYTTKNVTDTVTASASVVNVSLVRLATGIQENRTGMGASQQVSFVNGVIKLSNMSSAGSVRLVNATGEMMIMQSFQPAAQVSVRIGRNLSVGNYILSVTQDNGVIQKMIVVQ